MDERIRCLAENGQVARKGLKEKNQRICDLVLRVVKAVDSDVFRSTTISSIQEFKALLEDMHGCYDFFSTHSNRTEAAQRDFLSRYDQVLQELGSTLGRQGRELPADKVVERALILSEIDKTRRDVIDSHNSLKYIVQLPVDAISIGLGESADLLLNINEPRFKATGLAMAVLKDAAGAFVPRDTALYLITAGLDQIELHMKKLEAAASEMARVFAFFDFTASSRRFIRECEATFETTANRIVNAYSITLPNLVERMSD